MTTYEIYTQDSQFIEAFETLEEAVDFVENQIAWDKLIATLPPHPAIARY